jgi:hypothetical protein
LSSSTTPLRPLTGCTHHTGRCAFAEREDRLADLHLVAVAQQSPRHGLVVQ